MDGLAAFLEKDTRLLKIFVVEDALPRGPHGCCNKTFSLVCGFRPSAVTGRLISGTWFPTGTGSRSSLWRLDALEMNGEAATLDVGDDVSLLCVVVLALVSLDRESLRNCEGGRHTGPLG
jgi:hypothetical protein